MSIQHLHRIHNRIAPLFRRGRMRWFVQELQPTPETRILDVGGYPWCWEDTGVAGQITILNVRILPGLAERYAGRYQLVAGDGTALEYEDQAFDIVFSNSVIEHVGTYENQLRFANECRRVGRRVWVQTPARCFFIEPHLLTPFIHWFPLSLRRRLMRFGTVWGWLTRPTREQVESFLKEVRLLNRTEMQGLFPDCRILRETVGGLTKSYIAARTAA